MIDREHDFPIARQAKALGVARSSVYYKPQPVSAEDLELMRRLDELHLEHPFAGARMLRDLLRREGVAVSTRRVLSHRVSITMEAEFCVAALKEALAKYGKPEIFNKANAIRSSVRQPPARRISSSIRERR
jgi:hypothetical protein